MDKLSTLSVSSALLLSACPALAQPRITVHEAVVPYDSNSPKAAVIVGLSGDNLVMLRNHAGAVSAVFTASRVIESQNFPRIQYGETFVSNWDAGMTCTIESGGDVYTAPYWHALLVRQQVDGDPLQAEHGNDQYDLLQVHMECNAGIAR